MLTFEKSSVTAILYDVTYLNITLVLWLTNSYRKSLSAESQIFNYRAIEGITFNMFPK